MKEWVEGVSKWNVEQWGRMRANRTRLMKVYNPAEPKLRWQIDSSHPKVHHLICTAWNRLKKDFKGAQGLVGKSSVTD